MGSPLNSNTNAGATVMATSASLKLFADFFGVKAQSALHRSQKRENDELDFHGTGFVIISDISTVIG